ncbi:MAG: VanZ family protein [Methylophilaceae bacterium]|nr:VanZ family protein [Methylophilaceae bacterium]
MPIKPHVYKHRWVQVLAIIGLVLMLVGIFIGGREPGAGNLFNPPWDKVVHLGTYCIMAMLIGLAFRRMPLPLVLLMTVFIAACDETAQLYIPGRSADIGDYAADGLGCLLAILPDYWIKKKLGWIKD